MKSRDMIITMLLGAAFAILLVSWPVHHALAQSCVAPPSGLIGWWPGDGNANDLISGNHGTLSGGTAFAAGKVGQAFSFDGVDDFVSIGNPSNLHLSGVDFTVETWVNFTSLVYPPGSSAGPCFGPGCDMDIVSKMVGGNVNNTDGWRLAKQSDDHLWFCLGNGSNGCGAGYPTTVRTTTVVSPGVWYHVAGVKSSGGISIYVNGVLEESKPLPSFVDTDSADVHIGSYSGASGTALMYGSSDEVEIFKRALSASEILAIFNAGSAGKCRIASTVTLTGCTACQQGNVFVANVSVTNYLARWLEAKIGAYLPDGTPVNLMSSKHLELPPGFTFNGQVFQMTLPSGLPQGNYQFCARFLELEMGDPVALSCQPFTIGP